MKSCTAVIHSASTTAVVVLYIRYTVGIVLYQIPLVLHLNVLEAETAVLVSSLFVVWASGAVQLTGEEARLLSRRRNAREPAGGSARWTPLTLAHGKMIKMFGSPCRIGIKRTSARGVEVRFLFSRRSDSPQKRTLSLPSLPPFVPWRKIIFPEFPTV